MTTQRIRTILGGALAAILVAGSPAAAQSLGTGALAAPPADPPAARMTTGDEARLTAARLLVEAANECAPDDPRATTVLRTAAFYVDHLVPAQAAEWLVSAAQHALVRGDVETAAHSLVDAGIALARVQGEGFGQADLFDLADRATLLAGSPLLAESQREAILRRADALATLAAAGDR